jgi:hypothetical protein
VCECWGNAYSQDFPIGSNLDPNLLALRGLGCLRVERAMGIEPTGKALPELASGFVRTLMLSVISG